MNAGDLIEYARREKNGMDSPDYNDYVQWVPSWHIATLLNAGGKAVYVNQPNGPGYEHMVTLLGHCFVADSFDEIDMDKIKT